MQKWSNPKKIICIFLSVIFIMTEFSYSLVKADDAKEKGAVFEMVNGRTDIEAEAVQPLDNMGVIKSDATASGEAVIEFPSGDMIKDATGLAPSMSYTFSLNKDTTINVWARTIAPSGSNDSLWIGIDETDYKNVSIKKSDSWDWSSLLNSVALEAGVHTLNIIPREKNNKIDKLIISDNPLFTPSGDANSKDEVIQTPVYDMPEVKPAPGHPRLFFTEKDIPRILANMEKPQSAGAVSKMKELLDFKTDGSIDPPTNPATGNFNAKTLGAIEVWAFSSALHKDTALSENAVKAMRKYLETIKFRSGNYDNQGQTVYTIAAVYDWCYDSLSAEDKKFFAQSVRSIAGMMEIGWPPTKQNAVNGHGAEAQIMRDLLSAGIAMFDEYPDIYQNAGGRFFSEYINPRKYWYAANTFHQGAHYTAYRYQWEVLATKLAEDLGVKQIFGSDSQYLLYRLLYARRPDGKMLADGDVHSTPPDFYESEYMRSFILAGNYFKDPYLKQEGMRELPFLSGFSPTGNQSLNVPEFLIFNDPDFEGRPFTELPLTKYFGTPSGSMVARTSWAEGKEAPTTLAEFRINEVNFMNHQHLDAGNFQLYYKGLLATDSGFYQTGINDTGDKTNNGNTAYSSLHDYNYNKRSIAHNVMLVYDPNEKWTLRNMQNANDGGQKWLPENIDISAFKNEKPEIPDVFKTGKVLGHEFGPNLSEPDYTYLKGDIKNAYTDKVAGYERSFMFLNLKNKVKPAALIVFDRVESSNPDFKKTWLLHGLQEPQIENNETVFRNEKNGNNGKLTCDTLLPKEDNTTIEKVGGPGKEAFVDGTDYFAKVNSDLDPEGGGWRIEVSPKTPQKQDFFLNVLQVGDSKPDTAPLKPTLIETEKVVGVEIADRVVVFGKDKNRTEQPVSFQVKNNAQNEITVCDLKAGTWLVRKNGADYTEVAVTEEGGVALFKGDTASYELVYKNSNSSGKQIETVGTSTKSENNVSIVLDKKFVYSDTPATIQNDVTLVPMKVIFEKLGAKVTYDEATRAATATKDDITIKITEDSDIAYINGTQYTLAVPATTINDRFMVPLRFVSEALGAKVDWDEFAKIAYINTQVINKNNASSVAKEGVATIVQSEWSSEDENCPGTNSYDGDAKTRWAADGTSEWIVYTFDKEYDIDSVFLNFYKGTTRQTYFELQGSTDGVNYTTIIKDGVSNGKKDENEFKLEEPAKVKYIKYIGKGNSLNNWNSVNEVEFRTVK